MMLYILQLVLFLFENMNHIQNYIKEFFLHFFLLLCDLYYLNLRKLYYNKNHHKMIIYKKNLLHLYYKKENYFHYFEKYNLSLHDLK